MIKTLERILDGLPDQQLRLIKPINSREIAEGAFGALLPSDPTVNDDVANTSANGYFGSRMWWQNELTGDVWYCQTGSPPGAAVWVKIYPVPVPPATIVDAVLPVHSVFDGVETYTISIDSASPPFTPGAASDLQVWWETDGVLWQDAAGTIPATNGNPVGKWDDASGGGHALVEYVATPRPTFVTAVYQAKPCLRFSGSEELKVVGVSALDGAVEATFLNVVNFSASGNTNTVATAHGNGSDHIAGQQSGGPRWMISFNGGGQAYFDIGGTLGSLHVVTWRYNGAGATNADRVQGWFDGVQQTLTFSGTVAATLQANDTLWVGGFSNSFDFTGDLCAYIGYSRALSDPEVSALNAYLTNKWLGTDLPLTQFVGAGHGLESSGPPWAPTLSLTTPIDIGDLPAIPADYLSSGTLGAGIDLPADQLSAGTLDGAVDVPWGNISGAPAPVTHNYSVAGAGTNQAGATLLADTISNVTSSGYPFTDSGVRLPAPGGLDILWVWCSASAAINVYPDSGSAIKGGGTDNPYVLSAGTGFNVVCFVRVSATQWQTTGT